MVVALREQTPKKSKLSLFRIGKSSTKTAPAAEPEQPSHPSNTYPRSAEHSTPRNAAAPTSSGRISRSIRQAASEGASAGIAVHYQYPESSNLPNNYHWSSSSEASQQRSEAEEEQHYRRTRADSLPLQGFVHPADAAVAEDKFVRSNWPALAKIQTDVIAPSASGKHYRTRSHFSIPDVIVTTCEEEGEKQLVEISIPPSKRRSYVLREGGSNADEDRSSKKKSAGGFGSRARPAPLIQFEADEIKGMSRSGSANSLSSSPISPTSTTGTSTSSPSSASSSLSKGSTMGKRIRKTSFPMLFGRKSLDSARANVKQQQGYVDEPLPFTPTSPGSQPDGLLFSSHEGGSVSAPLSKSIFGRSVTGLPSPPVTPTSPSRLLTKKEIKAKAKEELALIKELERVDKLVKQHDVKAKKAQEKAEAKERKRAAKLTQVNLEFHQQGAARPSIDTTSSAKTLRKTIFQASTRATSTSGLARRTSVRGAPVPEVRTFVGERRGSEPILSNAPEARSNVSTPFSIDLPESERLPFSQPRAAPLPNIFSTPQPFAQAAGHQTSAPAPISPTKSKSSSPPRPSRPAPAPPLQPDIAPLNLTKDTQLEGTEAETSISEDPDDTQSWNRRSWSELNSGLSSGPLPSLIQPTVSSSTIDEEEEEERDARRARRASVQRVLALSDANGVVLQKRASLRKRGSQQYMLKRRSSHMESVDASDNKRSSAASLRRRSLIRKVGDEEGWKVVDAEEERRADERVIAQPDLSATKWDWVEEEEEQGRRQQNQQRQTLITGERMEVEVDLVLADLRAAQHADEVRKHGKEGSGEKTPTQETVNDPFAVASRKVSPPRPNRAVRREVSKEDGTGHSSSISSSDSFGSDSSGTGTAATMVDAAGKSVDEGMVCFSRPFSPQHQIGRFSIDDEKENEGRGIKVESGKGSKDSQFRLSLALAPLQPLDLFSQT